mmetsp:Transcript_34527/g.53892  ORF Transcript_34527/g.53892 Transcript_34527/m.53892 type:complete len:133 (-) Transcript_34527:194-592(-)
MRVCRRPNRDSPVDRGLDGYPGSHCDRLGRVTVVWIHRTSMAATDDHEGHSREISPFHILADWNIGLDFLTRATQAPPVTRASIRRRNFPDKFTEKNGEYRCFSQQFIRDTEFHMSSIVLESAESVVEYIFW